MEAVWTMKKKFNVTGTCISDMHYTVDVSNKLEKIKNWLMKQNILLLSGKAVWKDDDIIAVEKIFIR